MKLPSRLLPLVCLLLLTLAAPAQDDARVTFYRWTMTCPDPADTVFSVSVDATVPGCLHTDLLAHGLIPDPYYGTNEDSLQWLSYVPCTYRTDFWRSELPRGNDPELVLEGVVGYGEVFLNGQPLPHQDGNNVMDNAYRTWHFPLKGRVRKYNELEIRFTPAQEIIDRRKATVPYTLPDERAWLRTPPYQSGWDWGPKLTTCGITGNAYIVNRPLGCHSIYFIVDKNPLPKSTHMRLCEVFVHRTFRINFNMHVRFAHPTRHGPYSVPITLDSKSYTYRFGRSPDKVVELGFAVVGHTAVTSDGLWWPNGMGQPLLHDFSGEVKSGMKREQTHCRVGYRTVELQRERDSIGETFTFVINGIPTFVKGANWIPADFFTHRMTEDRYRELLLACKEANINMLRVWGGGIYEPDIFYDLCDELGIMVWQDFMFSCALYPGDSNFLYKVEQEAVDQLMRLRRHPCIVAWCGNNEVKNGWEDWGWQQNYTAEQRAVLEHDMHFLFDTLLARVVSDYAPGTPYIASSPLWGWGHPECCTEGDSHYWGVWWGEQPFEAWYDKTGRFMSEYGFQSYPDLRTLQTVMPDTALHLGSPELNNHQKHARGVQIIDQALERYFYRPDSLADYVYLSQLTQAYGVGMALEEHRRRMPYCMGTLFWQLNDCWPVASWSCIDYYGRRKALYYEVKRQFAPVILACDTLHGDQLPIYVVNDRSEPIADGMLELSLRDFRGNVLDTQRIEGLKAAANSSTFIVHYAVPDDPVLRRTTFLQMTLRDGFGDVVAEKCRFFDVPGRLELPAAAITVRALGDGVVEVSSPTLQYGVELCADVPGTFSDNYFTLLPGTPKRVTFRASDATTPPTSFSARALVLSVHHP